MSAKKFNDGRLQPDTHRVVFIYLLNDVQNEHLILYMLLIDRSQLADTWLEDTIAVTGLGLAG